MVGEDGGDDRDDLDYCFQLADLGGVDGESLGCGDGAEAGDEELSADDDDGDPRVYDARVVGDQDDVGRGDHQLVCQRIQQHAQGGDLLAAAGQVAVQAVGDGGEDEDAGGDQLLPTAQQAVGCGVGGKGRGEDPHQQRHGGDAAERNGVGQVHGPRDAAPRFERDGQRRQSPGRASGIIHLPSFFVSLMELAVRISS